MKDFDIDEAEGAMLAAAYIGIGLVGNPKIGEIQDHYGMGQLELISEAVRFGPFINRLLEVGYEVTREYPGVAEYQVTEPFGAWYGDQILTLVEGTVPDDKVVYDHLRTKVFEFFNVEDEDTARDLTAALASAHVVV